jgi:hypothetical protein
MIKDSLPRQDSQLFPLPNALRIDTKAATGVGDCVGNAIDGDHSARSTIIGLNRVRGPRAITRRITNAVVQAMERMFRRRRAAHISQKVFVFPPAIADRDTATAIAGVIAGAPVFATIMHHAPRSVFFAILGGFAVGTASVADTFCKALSATRSLAAAQQMPVNHVVIAAIAAAAPEVFSCFFVSYFCNGELTETVSGQVYNASTHKNSKNVTPTEKLQEICNLAQLVRRQSRSIKPDS